LFKFELQRGDTRDIHLVMRYQGARSITGGILISLVI